MKNQAVQNETSLWLVGQMDQLGAQMQDHGRIVGEYYTAMLKNGLPEDVCRDLVRQWHAMYWLQQIFPDSYPNFDME